MSEEITEAELREIEARADAAAPGPWYGSRRVVLFEERDVEGHRYGVSLSGEMMPAAGCLPAGDMADATAEFIAASRSDVPRIIAEIRRLRALLSPSEEP